MFSQGGETSSPPLLAGEGGVRSRRGYRLSFGVWGEDQACEFLQRNGFKIIDRNFHTTQGEIDIIAAKGGDYYFIEVKSRQEGELATDLAVTRKKICKLEKTVKVYCYQNDVSEGSYILAGLLVIVDKAKTSVNFRLAAYC